MPELHYWVYGGIKSCARLSDTWASFVCCRRQLFLAVSVPTVFLTACGQEALLYQRYFTDGFYIYGLQQAKQATLARLARFKIYFALLSIRVLSNHEARNQSHAFYLRASPPRARCLTLALPPNGGGPGSHLRFTDVTLGCPLATRARGGRLTTLERSCSNPPLLVVRTPGARGSGIN